MFKKIMSLVLAMMIVMSIAAVSFSAAQVEITDEAVDVDVIEQGANGDVASEGADTDVAATGADVLKFDANTIGWSGMKAVQFYVYDLDTGAELIAWGSKKLNGTDADGDNVWEYDPAANGMSIESGKQYCIIFVNADTKEQTYDLVMDSSCLNDIAKATGNSIENPVDSSKSTIETVWTNSSLGPRLQITSVGNLVGNTVPKSSSKYGMFVGFLASGGKSGLQNALSFSGGKTAQEIIDDVANKLGLKKGDVKDAIKEAASSNKYSTDTYDWSKDWDESKSSLSDGTSSDAHSTGDGGTDGSSSSGSDSSGSDSSSSGSGSGSSGSGSSGSGSSSSSSASGSASNTQTGQGETVLFIMLGVMVAAAGVIFFARRKERT